MSTEILIVDDSPTQAMKLQFILEENGFKIDYVEIAQTETLAPVTNWDGNQKLVALVAASLNEVRLIDNMLLNE